MKDFFNQKFLALVTTLGVFLTPIIPLLTIIGVLVIADFYTAYRIGKIKHNEPFSSKKFRITITKTGIYFSILIAARGIEMLYDYPIIVEITAALMIIAEARSLDEHYNTLTGKFLLKNILDFLNSKILNLKKSDGSN